jgi:hypothetical protein
MIHGTSAAAVDFFTRGGRPEATVAVFDVKGSMNITGHALSLVRKYTIRFAGNALSGGFATNLMNDVG